MALTNYTELKDSITKWLRRTVDVNLDDFIKLAETTMIYGDSAIGVEPLRVWQMESLESVTITAASRTAPLPTRFISAKNAYFSEDRILTYKPMAALNDAWITASPDTPSFYSYQDSNLLLAPTPSETTTLYLDCYIAPAALSSSNTVNAILTNYPNIYLYGSLAAAFGYLRNTEEEMKFYKKTAGAIKSANDSSIKSRMSGTLSAPTPIRRRVP